MSSQPSSSSSSPADNNNKGNGSGKKRRTDNVVWSHWPSISIMLPPQGLNMRDVDERCFVYCTQTVRGRVQHQTPTCRSICFRKVFRHEVRRAMSMHELQDALKHYEKEHGRLPERFDASVKVKYLLPEEGQRIRTPKHQKGPISLEDAVESDASSPPEEVRYWEPGWYIWTSTHRYAIQEHIDSMRMDFSQMAQWKVYKDAVNQNVKQVKEGLKAGTVDKEKLLASLPKRQQEYPDYGDSTLLVSLPPPHVVIGSALHNYLQPTWKLFDVVNESVQSGDQKAFAGMMWEKAKTPEPWILFRNVCSKMWKLLNDGPPDDEAKGGN